MTSDIRSAPRPPHEGGRDAASSQLVATEAEPSLTRRARLARQPAQGLSGLVLLVIPVAVILAFGAGGAQGSTIVLGPLAVFALAPTAMIAFWWENWPGTRLWASWSGWADTLLIAVVAVALTIAGQLLVGSFDLRGIFLPNPAPGHSPVFPITLPLAGAAFVAIMQLTFVCERWPLSRFGSTVGGLLALAAAWAAALLLFFGLVGFQPPSDSGLIARSGPLAPVDLGALLVLTGLWQVWFYIAWEGWPFTRLTCRRTRLLAGNAVVVAAGIISYLLADAAGLAAVTMIAAAGSFIAAALLLGLLLDGWLPRSPKPSLSRPITVVVDLVLAAILYASGQRLRAPMTGVRWTTASTWRRRAARSSSSMSRPSKRPVTPEVAGSSPVAHVKTLQMRMLCVPRYRSRTRPVFSTRIDSSTRNLGSPHSPPADRRSCVGRGGQWLPHRLPSTVSAFDRAAAPLA
jgi:hypothetical protein